MTVLIRNAKVIDSASPYHLQHVDIFIEKGTIHTIGKKLENKADKEIEAKDLHVSIGWTDIFADYCEPGFEHKENIQTGLASAAHGGFTTVFSTPNTNPTVSSKSVVQFVKQQADGNIVSLHPIGAISHHIEGKNLAEMLDMQANGAVAFSDGWQPIQNANLMLKALEYAKSFGGTLIQIPTDKALAEGGLMHEGLESTKLGMPGIPTLAETINLHRDIELLRYTGSKLHLTGISSAESVAMIRAAKAEGLAISCSVSPYHLALNDESLRSYESVYKVSPPLRSEKDRKALVAGLLDGTIDCIASHHRPQNWDEKSKEFEYAAEGMNVQEMAFAIANNCLQNEGNSEQWIAAMGENASRIFGLSKAAIKEGAAADLTLFSTTEKTEKTEKTKLQSKSANNPFMGKSLIGRVIGIVKGNKILLNN